MDLKKALFGFIKAQLTLISITTVIILIGLLILRVDYAITIALVTGSLILFPTWYWINFRTMDYL